MEVWRRGPQWLTRENVCGPRFGLYLCELAAVVHAAHTFLRSTPIIGRRGGGLSVIPYLGGEHIQAYTPHTLNGSAVRSAPISLWR